MDLKFKYRLLKTSRVVLIFMIAQFLSGASNLGFASQDAYSRLLPALELLLKVNKSGSACNIVVNTNDPKFDLEYLGLYYFSPLLETKRYGLSQLSDDEFNDLTVREKLKVADKLLSSLFFGYSHDELLNHINSGSFLCSIKHGMTEISNPISEIEDYILNDEFFFHYDYYDNEVHDILARFYVMEHLDNYFLQNWIAYILTQTIMFSPAYELDTAHLPDVANVYNWLVIDMMDEISMRYSTYLHMTSLENWRRFRSPEDNGREMMEIFLLDFDDEKVPKAATALQNWYLDEDHDTLVIGLNENKTPLSLFGTVIYDGFDFYRELVKTNEFTKGVTARLVDFFFTTSSSADKERIVNSIVRSKPERWEDILLQIVFSREYLLYSEREKSAEEVFYSFAKKAGFKHYTKTFKYLNRSLQSMNQASMRYKLGKLERTPLDSLSFANYHKFVRESLVYNHVCSDEYLNTYSSSSSDGWTPDLIHERHFTLVEDDPVGSMTSFINYLFLHFVQRTANQAELELFLTQMLNSDRTKYNYSYNLSVQKDNGCFYGRKKAAMDVMDYLSRLTNFYWYEEVK